ncbi:hypothetical protein LCGC14_2471800 [marine sediment metagenome]|uniref:HD domain-containing protein n=1 Tax=marine sediment metagenome TaxID=412755 RepID=A0A0F9BA45_9ZZZZ
MINHIITYTGKSFNLLEPKPEMVCIEDIAHSLAYQCRYTGHTREFYSVAQHCVLMTRNPDLPGDPMGKLLHDAGEAYIGDIARPWKSLLSVSIGHGHCGISNEPIRKFEQKIQRVIGLALGLDLTHSVKIKESDVRMMATEVRDLMPPGFTAKEWGIDISNPVKEVIDPWPPFTAEIRFLELYNGLRG